MRVQAAILAIVTSGTAVGQGASGEAVLEALSAAGTEAAAAVGRGFDAVDPAVRAMLAPVLAAWIAASREAALERGVEPVPAQVRAALADHVPDEILDIARWRIDDSVLSVQQSLFRMGYTPAVTLDFVVVFAKPADAEDPALWAHELFHVMQYRDWGVDGFVERYLADYEAVERDAAEFRWQWMKATGRVPIYRTLPDD